MERAFKKKIGNTVIHSNFEPNEHVRMHMLTFDLLTYLLISSTKHPPHTHTCTHTKTQNNLGRFSILYWIHS